MFDIEKVRDQFPMLKQKVHGKNFIYLDSAATTLKPQLVIDEVSKHYSQHCSNIHRGLHFFSELGTQKYESTRTTVQKFLNAKTSDEIILTRGTTESINLVAQTFGERFLNKGDEIIITQMEHHSNIVPWQLIAEKRDVIIKVVNVTPEGELDLEHFKTLLTCKTKIVSVVHISNSLGTINPIKEIIDLTHQAGAKILIDAAQSVAHHKVDVQELDVDFLVFSGHKIFGPTGIGVLYGKEDLLNELPPYQGGGAMIDKVTFEKTTYNKIPYKFEAGTPNIAGAMGLKVALEFVSDLGIANIAAHEENLLSRALSKIQEIKEVSVIGNAKNRCSVLSFNMLGAHPSDVGMLIDKKGVAIRTGHHCTQPLWDFYNLPGSARASFSIYNTEQEVDYFINSLVELKDFF